MSFREDPKPSTVLGTVYDLARALTPKLQFKGETRVEKVLWRSEWLAVTFTCGPCRIIPYLSLNAYSAYKALYGRVRPIQRL